MVACLARVFLSSDRRSVGKLEGFACDESKRRTLLSFEFLAGTLQIDVVMFFSLRSMSVPYLAWRN